MSYDQQSCLSEVTIASVDTAIRSVSATECRQLADESVSELRCWPEWWRAVRWAGGSVVWAGVVGKTKDKIVKW